MKKFNTCIRANLLFISTLLHRKKKQREKYGSLYNSCVSHCTESCVIHKTEITAVSIDNFLTKTNHTKHYTAKQIECCQTNIDI